MMKKLLALMLTAVMALTLAGCSMSNEAMYEQAQLYLGNRDYQYAASLFDQLGEYRDSADYALYALGLDALEDGDLLLARSTLLTVAGFKSADRYLAYLNAEQLANAGHIDEALMAFEQLGAFYRSADRADDLRELRRQAVLHQADLQLKAGNIDAARELLAPYAATDEAQALLNDCDAALQRKAYDAAQALYADGHYLEALDAFTELDQLLDSPTRAQLCRSALYRQAEEAFPHVTLATCGDLMALYDKLSGYMNADVRFETLADAFGTRLALLEEAGNHPCVTYGRAVTAENGAAMPVLWRVLAADNESAMLICCAAITGRSAATPSDLTMPLEVPDMPAEPVLGVPADWSLDAAEVQRMLEENSTLQAALTDDDSLCARWMSRLLDADGAVLCGCILADNAGGLRAVITVPMADWALTGGQGTWADPYR